MKEIIKHITEPDFNHDVIITEWEYRKVECQKCGDENGANIAWANIQIITIHKHYIAMFNLLHEERYYEAWCLMEQIELLSNNLLRNFPDATTSIMGIPIIICRLQKLYPYKLFISTVNKISKKKCSICGSVKTPRNHCGHIVGRVYNGEYCQEEILDFQMVGADFVANPEHKCCVPMMTDEDGNTIDHYDYSLIKYLMQSWNSPYNYWHYEISEIYTPVAQLPSIPDNSLCPCGSMKTFVDCCKHNPKGVKGYEYRFSPGL